MRINRTYGLRLLPLLTGSILPIASLSAQTYSPSPAVEGTPLTFTLGFPQPGASDIFDFTMTIYGPSTFNQSSDPSNPGIVAPEVYRGGGLAVNDALTLTTPSLVPGLYRIQIYTDSRDFPTQLNFYYFTVYGKNGSNNGAVQGQYLFQLSGTQGGLAAQPVFALGSITTDGAGDITGGVIDVNSPGAVLQAVPVKGTYQFNVNGSGVLNLNTSQGSFQLPFYSPSSPSTVVTPIMTGFNNPLYPLDPSAYLYGASIKASFNNGVSTMGTLEQTLIPGASESAHGGSLDPLTGKYNATLTGGTKTATGMPVFVTGASQFTFDLSGAVTNQGTLTTGGISFPYPSLSGTYANFNYATGRATMTLPNKTAGAPPEDFAVYSTDLGESFYYLSLTPRQQSANVISGQGQRP